MSSQGPRPIDETRGQVNREMRIDELDKRTCSPLGYSNVRHREHDRDTRHWPVAISLPLTAGRHECRRCPCFGRAPAAKFGTHPGHIRPRGYTGAPDECPICCAFVDAGGGTRTPDARIMIMRQRLRNLAKSPANGLFVELGGSRGCGRFWRLCCLTVVPRIARSEGRGRGGSVRCPSEQPSSAVVIAVATRALREREDERTLVSLAAHSRRVAVGRSASTARAARRKRFAVRAVRRHRDQ